MTFVQQYQYEIKTWNRLLDYLEEENIQYKNRISEILKNNIHTGLLETIEVFLSEFVREDQIISLCRRDIEALKGVIDKGRDGALNGNNFEEITFNQDKLRKEIEMTERRFNALKFDFSKYLSERLSLFTNK